MLCVGIGTPPGGALGRHRRGLLHPRAADDVDAEGRLRQDGRDARATMFLEAGGTIVTGAEVARVVVEGGRARGDRDRRRPALHRQGRRLRACDARRLFLEQLPAGRRARRTCGSGCRDEDHDAVVLPGPARRRHGPHALPRADQAAQLHLPVPRHRQGDGELPQRERRGGRVLPLRRDVPPAGDGAARAWHSVKLECPTTLDSGDRLGARQGGIADTFIRRTEADHPRPRDARRREARSGRRSTSSATPATPTARSPAGRSSPELLTRGRPQQRTGVPGLYMSRALDDADRGRAVGHGVRLQHGRHGRGRPGLSR